MTEVYGSVVCSAAFNCLASCLQVENKQKPSDRETVNRAFKENANITLTELQQRYAKADNGSQWARQQLEAQLTRLQGIGALSKEATRNNIGGCVASRLNPSQFPDIPRVSFILQYFKRPWMIGKLVEVVQECNQVRAMRMWEEDREGWTGRLPGQHAILRVLQVHCHRLGKHACQLCPLCCKPAHAPSDYPWPGSGFCAWDWPRVSGVHMLHGSGGSSCTD